jgi:hypothetical protein
MTWVAAEVNALGIADKPTLEVGALNVNGTVRGMFGGQYVGVDMRPGPGVDMVMNAHELSHEWSHAWEVIVCLEMLEHDDKPWRSVIEMHEVAMPGATLLLSARGYDHRGCFPIHDYPADMWRFSPSGIKALVEDGGWTVEYVRSDPEAPGVFVVAHA